MSPHATLLVNPCTKFEMDTTYRSSVRRLQFSIGGQLKVPILCWEVNEVKFIFHLSRPNPQKVETLAMARTTYHQRRIACGVCPEMRPVAVAKRPNKDRNFQTGYLLRPPTSTQPPEILHAGSCPGISYIFQVS